jgi:hypothetical protein
VEPTETEASAMTETAAGVPAARHDTGLDLEDPSLYFNRELSCLDFNVRVLQIA